MKILNCSQPMLKQAVLAAMLAVISNGSFASFIAESEPNNSLATAQNIDGAFSSDFVTAITDFAGTNISTSTDHVSIRATGDGSYDYYSFSVSGPMRGWFDIDDNNFDTEIAIWDSAFNILGANDDATETGHTGGSFPSFLTYDFAAAGTYFVGVAAFPSTAENGGWTGSAAPQGGSYILHASLEGSSVPVPATLALFGLGLVGISSIRRKQHKAG